ncbi:MAG: 8-amino-7-oxononanoate synthase [Pirellulales bacterium]|nr:8-amino-7-oxononanoate synthase [Pirellulales bacterium]
MVFDCLRWIDEELPALEAKGRRRKLLSRSNAQAAVIALDGREYVNFGTNDYLGLAADPRLAEAVASALDQYGWGSGASPLILGHAELHRRLEEQIAEFEGVEAALLFTSGFAANSGTIAALVGPGDAVFSDRKNHASLFDGCRLSRADIRVYPHADPQALDDLLEKTTAYRRRLIVTDSLFSMDGDFAPLKEIAEIAEKRRAMLLVDEAHATGVFGDRGRGACEMLGVEDRVPVRIGTLSKALGGIGGFVAGSRTLVDWLVNRARPYVFSTALPAAVSAAGLAALEIVKNEPFRRGELLVKAADLRRELSAQGWRLGNSASQILPVIVGESERAVALSQKLRARGLFVPAIRPPTVPEGEACLRISLSYAHSPAMIGKLLESLYDARSLA